MAKNELIDDASQDEIENAVKRYNSVYIANKILDEPLIGLTRAI